jgi:hypothetical protein
MPRRKFYYLPRVVIMKIIAVTMEMRRRTTRRVKIMMQKRKTQTVLVTLEMEMRKSHAHSSDSTSRCSVSRTRNFGLWNLYSSKLDDLTPRARVITSRRHLLRDSGRTVDPLFGQCFMLALTLLRIPDLKHTLTSNHIHGAISSHVRFWDSTGSVQLHQVECPLLLCVGFTQLRF